MNKSAPFNIVLIEPEIPPNTGNIARLCAATHCKLHLVEPLGFEINDKTLKRAGMDYWEHVNWVSWPSLDAFFASLGKDVRFFLFTTKASSSFYQASFQKGDYLIFGRETKGLPESLLKQHSNVCLKIPMPNEAARSLNLATSVGIIAYEALRQIGRV